MPFRGDLCFVENQVKFMLVSKTEEMALSSESLSLDHCKSLIKVHESAGTLDKLVTSNLLLCSNLKTLPSSFKLKSLRTLVLTGCSKLRKFPEIVEKMEHLEEILLQGTAIKELPQSIEHLIGLKFLFLDSRQKLKHLPRTFRSCNTLILLISVAALSFRSFQSFH